MSKAKHRHRNSDLPNFAGCLIPRIEGAYGAQAIALGRPGTGVGIYRQTIPEAEAWLQSMVKSGEHDWFVLYDDKFWSVYDRSGKQVARLKKLPGRPREECKKPIDVDRTELEADAMDVTGRNDLCCLAVLEDHAGANCADQVNYAALASQLVQVADPEDLNQIYLIESGRWRCRVAGLFAAVQRLGEKTQNKLLYCHASLSRSDPLDSVDHRSRLSRRLARLDYRTIGVRLRRIFSEHRFEDHHGNVFVDGDYFVDQFLAAPLKKRQRFMSILLEMEGYESEPGSPERLILKRIEYNAETPIHIGMRALDLLQ